jgi:hypothetical protein
MRSGDREGDTIPRKVHHVRGEATRQPGLLAFGAHQMSEAIVLDGITRAAHGRSRSAPRESAEEAITVAVDADNAKWDLRERLKECEMHVVSCL